MKIKSAEFVASFTALSQLPKKRLPEIAFAGRSNVGKSSLINKILNRKKLAKTSGTPGKTRQLNYFLINDAFHFVDLPGYGFAKVPKTERQQWRRLIEAYLSKNQHLRVVVSLIDSRMGPTALDLELIEWLAHLEIPILAVATKLDKLSRNQAKQAEARITSAIERYPVNGPIFCSAKTGAGKSALLLSLKSFLEN